MSILLYILAFLESLILSFIAIPKAIQIFENNGHTIPDRYKLTKPEIANHGAFVVFFSSIIISSLIPLQTRVLNRMGLDISNFQITDIEIHILFIITIFGLLGVVDDLINMGWWPKIIFPIFLSFPIINIISLEFFEIPFLGEYNLRNYAYGNIEYRDIFSILIIPIYMTVVPNLMNMHSGFNGLQSGLSVILLFTLIIKCQIDGDTDNLLIFYIFFGGIFSLWLYNRYPSRIFEGNMGSMAFGAGIASLIIIKNYYWFGIFILIPHIVDFLMLVYLRFNSIPFIKFGDINSEGKIIAPNPIKMKFLLPYYFLLDEKKTVFYLHFITIFFCIFGLIIF